MIINNHTKRNMVSIHETSTIREAAAFRRIEMCKVNFKLEVDVQR